MLFVNGTKPLILRGVFLDCEEMNLDKIVRECSTLWRGISRSFEEAMNILKQPIEDNFQFGGSLWYFLCTMIWPGISYETALDKAALSTLSDRRSVSCIKFIGQVWPGYPLYPLLHNRVVPMSTSVCLRSESSSRPMARRTERFSNFVTVTYQSCQ